jgi:hypothetical protein
LVKLRVRSGLWLVSTYSKIFSVSQVIDQDHWPLTMLNLEYKGP